MIGKTLSHYRIIEKVADGGMGVVYRAHDEQLERDVALKVLPTGTLSDNSSRRQFRKEALALAKLNHPNIETIYEFDTQDGIDFLVMEYVPGNTLADRLVGGTMPEKEVLTLGIQIAAALEEAHNRGVVHRDLKPRNIAITARGQAKVLDFGLAKFLTQTGEVTSDTLTDTKAGAGTLPYMSPEQLQGESVDARADIYTTGAVLYEMTAGRRAFAEKLPSRLIDAILHQPPVAPRALNSRISPGLERIILKCLDKDPAQRYQSAKELLVDLRWLETSSSMHTTLPRSSPSVWRGVARLTTSGVAGLLTLAVLMTGLSVRGWRDRLMGWLAPPKIGSLAVLPLENLSHDPEQEYFADGMTEALITDIAKIRTLRVTSRTSVMQYKGTKKRLSQIARELNVDVVVEGSVQRSGDRVKIVAQLIDARSDRNLWTESYQSDLSDVLALEDNVARAVAGEVRVQLTPQESASLSNSPTLNPRAYEAYLRARYLWNKRKPEDLRKALVEFKKAIDLDPTSALAWGGLADGYSLLVYYDMQSPLETMPLAKAAAQKALQLDDSLAEAHASLANIKWAYDWDSGEAEKEFERALALNPNYATAREWYGLYLTQVGRFDEAIAEMQRAQELDPLEPVIQVNVGRCYYYARRYDKALELLLQLEHQEPDYWIVHAILGQTYLAMGRLDDAIHELERAHVLSPDSLRNLGVLGDAYGRAGRRGEALRLLDELSNFSLNRYAPPVYSAMILMGVGDKPQALTFLEKAYADRSDWIMQLKVEPEFDPLRTDLRFQQLLRHTVQKSKKGR
jgi:serine/threonine protein kinase/tetratricopeptide (TPR) repeat protein